MKLLLAVGVAMAASATRAEVPEPAALHFGISTGLRLAYDGLGVRFEGRSAHFGAYLGTGVLGFVAGGSDSPGASGAGFCAGMRWSAGDGEGLFVSFNGSYARYSENYDRGLAKSDLVYGTLYTLTATIGVRQRWGHVFLEESIGGGVVSISDPPGGNTNVPPPGVHITRDSSPTSPWVSGGVLGTQSSATLLLSGIRGGSLDPPCCAG